MQASTDTLTTTDGTPLFINRWLPDGPPAAIVQIAHGVGEHSSRYERFAEALTAAGYAVYADDHRGHGQTHPAGSPDHGFFAETEGFQRVVSDLHEVTELARREHPGLPVFLFGHSLGSFLSRGYAINWGAELTGLVLSGTSADQPAKRIAGSVAAFIESRLRGKRHPSTMIGKLIMEPLNAPFKPNRTPFDWLSRDEAEVDKYIADPEAGNPSTSGYYSDLSSGVGWISKDSNVARVPKGLPILLVSGSDDPVGEMGKGVPAVEQQYKRLGVTDVTATLYPGARHEILNETNRDEVTADIVAWLGAHLPKK